ncbi:MAG: alpha/beta fold hydrolase [Verrucomicrobia bacterium]|nr:alpha/beta fold hydrolase [Verrucomicrobiota bacterium]
MTTISKLRWLAASGACFLLLAAGLLVSCRTATLPVPPGVTKRTERVELTGKKVAVDIYLPAGVQPAPVVVVAHGFSRSRKNMAGWGGLLAANGFIAAVPDLPGFADYQRNSRAVTELLAWVQAGKLSSHPVATNGGAVVGFSLGGLATLLAAADDPNIRCWVGVDPVDQKHVGAKAAKSLRIPAVVLRAELSNWNWRGNARSFIKNAGGPLFALRVKNANHCDPEHPGNLLGKIACGEPDPARRDTFERYTLAALRNIFYGDDPALTTLMSATNDPRVADVVLRQGERFIPVKLIGAPERP